MLRALLAASILVLSGSPPSTGSNAIRANASGQNLTRTTNLPVASSGCTIMAWVYISWTAMI
jgi:hypothetical protein